MPAIPDPLRPTPLGSALLGFLQRVAPGERYAMAPLGRYTRACVQDVPPQCFGSEGRRLVGFIDDAPAEDTYFDRTVGTLGDATGWPIDALILTRDTHDAAMRKRFLAMREQGLLQGVRLIDQPAPTLDAMLAHLGTYEPGCKYAPDFIAACQAHQPPPRTGSTLLCTFDAEVFPSADRDAVPLYAIAMRELVRIFRESGGAFTLCVQLRDTPGGMQRTPPQVIEDVLRTFGPPAIALHGIDHAMPSDGYAAEWFQHGLDELRSAYGVETEYWAPPGWTLNWRTLRVLRDSPIRCVRGIQTGVNVRRGTTIETLRFPYRVGELWQIPYAYADWMFADIAGRRLDDSGIVPLHERLAELASAGPCMIESVFHPFRLVGQDWRERLRTVWQTLECYSRRGVALRGVAEFLGQVPTSMTRSLTQPAAARVSTGAKQPTRVPQVSP